MKARSNRATTQKIWGKQDQTDRPTTQKTWGKQDQTDSFYTGYPRFRVATTKISPSKVCSLSIPWACSVSCWFSRIERRPAWICWTLWACWASRGRKGCWSWFPPSMDRLEEGLLANRQTVVAVCSLKFMLETSISTDCDCCAFASKFCGQLPKNTISRNYKITNKRLLPCVKELVHNVSSWSRVSQSIMVGSARGIVV